MLVRRNEGKVMGFSGRERSATEDESALHMVSQRLSHMSKRTQTHMHTRVHTALTCAVRGLTGLTVCVGK